MHWLDRLLALRALGPKLFAHGLGDDATLTRLAATPLDGPAAPIALDLRRVGDGFEATFQHPTAAALLPRDAATAHVRLIPAKRQRALYVHLASTGDEGWRRRAAVVDAARRRGLGALLLENPYYGRRRPSGRAGPDLHTFVEQLAMSLATALEARSLLTWLARTHADRVGITGFSMGGSVAALTASAHDAPLAIVPAAAGHAGDPVFLEGALSRFLDFRALGGDAGRARVRQLLVASDLELRPAPPNGSRAILVAARDDGYVPAASVTRLERTWRARGVPAQIRWLHGGHGTLLLRAHGVVAQAMSDALQPLPA